MYIVGVDIAKRSHEATVIDVSGNTIKKPFNFKAGDGNIKISVHILPLIRKHFGFKT